MEPKMNFDECAKAVEVVAKTLRDISRDTGIRFELEAYNRDAKICALSISPASALTDRVSAHLERVFKDATYGATFDNGAEFFTKKD